MGKHRHVAAATTLLAFLLTALLGTGAARADEPGSTLYEKRLGVIKGTGPGIQIIGPRRAASAPAAAGAASAPGMATAQARTEAAAPATKPLVERLGDAVKWGDPPSGQPLSAARRAEAAGGGIVLPTAPPSSAPLGGSRPRTPD